MPGATVNEKSCLQMCTAGPRRGFKTIQLDLFPQDFACLANVLSLCGSWKEGGSKEGEMPESAKKPKEVVFVEQVRTYVPSIGQGTLGAWSMGPAPCCGPVCLCCV